MMIPIRHSIFGRMHPDLRSDKEGFMQGKSIHLVCNAHIDPVWLWEWEEGAAEALATFRTAADLCEEFPGFIFNHNEALLYKWVEAYEPALFKRIRRLVKQGKWHIMGGWYLQPDCNMPSGESFVRQVLLGKRYFREKFGVDVTTGVNLDPFGHTRGLVQILAKSGYDAYLFCRPTRTDCPVPAPDFLWVGYDGSAVRATLATAHYNSAPGDAGHRLAAWREAHPDEACSLLLWGVGNHGGGPSRRDLQDLARTIHHAQDARIVHSTPARYFAERRLREPHPRRHEGDLNPWAVGCYTSMSRIKRRHRRLENELYATEKMATTTALQKLMAYPRAALHEASCDLALSEFHDALPGTSIRPVEQMVLRTLDHGLEILARIRARAFFALATGQPKARRGEFPILVYNPHPHRVQTIIECELQTQWPHGTRRFAQPRISVRGRPVPAQAEKELSNINEDHRKRVVFPAVLEAGCMNRFSCRLEMIARRPPARLREARGRIRFKTRDLEVHINARTGLIDRYRAGGVDYLLPQAFRPLVMADNSDPWGMTVKRFRTRAGCFKLMSRAAGSRFSGVAAESLPSVRAIEDGPVRSVVEAVFSHGSSFICQQYKLPKSGTEMEVVVQVHWAEKDRMLKLSVPSRMRRAALRGQVAYGIADLPANGDEAVAQRWVALVAEEEDACLTCINDGTYGCDMARGELRLSLLRAPAYAGHPTGQRPIVQQDRYTPRTDQGEHLFRFWLRGGSVADRLKRVGREAQARNERPFALTFAPPGTGHRPQAGITLSDQVIEVAAFKMAEEGNDVIVRLFEPTGEARAAVLALPPLGVRTRVKLSPFEVKTLRVSPRTGRVREVDLLEKSPGRRFGRAPRA
jgi:alpha-mannosidase